MHSRRFCTEHCKGLDMAKDPELKRREAEEKRRLVEACKTKIKPLLTKTPAKHSTWSYQQTLSFKEALSTAKKVFSSERVTPIAAQQALKALEAFHA